MTNPQRSTLLDLVEQGYAKNTTGVAIATKREGVWRSISVPEFKRDVEHFALGLHDLGVGPGDRVALHAENSTEWVIADNAILSLGAASVPIYTTQPADQIEHILNDAQAKVYIVSTKGLHGPVANLLLRVPSLKATIGILGAHHETMLDWRTVLEKGKARALASPMMFTEMRSRVKPDDLATLIYTSGTTGTPKGVMLTHANIASNVTASLERMPWDIEGERGKKILSYLPLSHVFERMLCYLYLSIGYPIWFIERFEDFLQDIQHVKPVHFSTVPRLLEKVYAGIKAKGNTMSGVQKKLFVWAVGLAEKFEVEKPLGTREKVNYALADALVYKKFRTLFGGNLVAITSGGAALSGEIMNFFNAIGVFCGQGYGLTETSPVIAVYMKGRLRAGSVGIPLRGVEVRIAEDGEICVRGPGVMRGYFNQPQATADVIDADGWFKTGDIGRLDPDGHLFITDRKKELFKLSTGKYVAPQPIEARLAASPYVEQSLAVGQGMPYAGALIVPNLAAIRSYFEREGRAPSSDAPKPDPRVRALIEAEVKTANEGLAPWEQIKKFALVDQPWTVENGELTPTMKLKRRVIHERYANLIREIYS
jgi:long-chain acyl-CoA synthetase